MKKSNRPVKCAVCQSQLFYSDEEGYEPEVKVEVSLPKWQEAVECKNVSIFGTSEYYIHIKCWNKLEITFSEKNTINFIPEFTKIRFMYNGSEKIGYIYDTLGDQLMVSENRTFESLCLAQTWIINKRDVLEQLI